MRLTALIIILLYCASSHAQREDYNWVIGSCSEQNPDTLNFGNMLIAFSPDSFTIERICANYFTQFNNASISSSAGELLYFSNGSLILGADYEVIAGGDGLQPNYPTLYPLPNATLLLPAPGDSSKTYHLEPDIVSFNDQNGQLQNAGKDLRYTLIEQLDDNDPGTVIEKQVLINSDTLGFGMLTATQHANGRDWWIVVKKYNSNQYYIYLLDPTGIQLHNLQSIGQSVVPGFGQARFSPDGQWYGLFTQGGGYPPFTDWRWDLYRFDRCSGELSEHLPYLSNEEGLPGGIAFSPNSQLMYISVYDRIFQYNLTASDIIASELLVAEYDGFVDQFGNIDIPTRFYSMQLTPHNKIFISVPNITSRHLHIIHAPDKVGVSCAIEQHGLELPQFNDFNIPNLPHFRSGPETGSLCDSLSLQAAFSFNLTDPPYAFQFSDESLGQPTDWLWDFGDGSTAVIQNPMHTFPDTGSYQVCLTVSKDQINATTCQSVQVLPTSVSTADSLDNIDIFPNPTSGFCEIQSPPGLQIYRINLYSINGQLLGTLEPKTTLDFSEFAAGIYTLEIWGKGRKIVKRIAKL